MNVVQELKVIADFYDFMLWMIQHTEKFPRHHRYSLRVVSTMKDMKNIKRD